MMRYLIVGAGGFGRELACWINDGLTSHERGEFSGLGRFAGFLDDSKTSPHAGYPHVIGSVFNPPELNGYLLLMAIGDPSIRERVVEHLTERGGIFGTFVHRTAIIARTARYGVGSIICPNVVISADAIVGEHCILNIASTIGHDVDLGDFSTLSSHVDLTGGVKVGKRCFFGSRASALPHVKIGEDCVIGAGAVAVRNVSAMGTLYEQPSRYLHDTKVSK